MAMEMLLNVIMPVLFLQITNGFASSLSLPNEVWQSRRIVVRRNATTSNNDTIIAIKDDTVVLECVFNVSGWSSIQWVMFGHQVGQEVQTPTGLPVGSTSGNGRVSTATLRKLGGNDRGRYSCILATLSGISKTYNFQVIVKGKPSCHTSNCGLNGLCLETMHGYKCMCNKGFVGASCELTDPCSSLPCLNNGTCSTQGERFNCSCQAGFDGAVCEREVCSGNVCGTGATCKVIDGKRKCTCPYNKAGDICQYTCSFNRYYCSYTTCLISIRNGRQQEECRCDDNRRSSPSRQCMMLSDVRNECSDRGICNGHGNCYDQVFGYRCNCHSYAYGENCKLYNECRAGNNLCGVNGGTCVDLPVGYKCRDCPDGQTGDKCQYKDDPCKVTCRSTAMTVSCDMRFLSSKLRNIPIYANEESESCRFPSQGRREYYYNSYRNSKTMTISYERCGTTTDYHDDYVVYQNRLRAGSFGKVGNSPNRGITREAGHFTLKVKCTLPLVSNATKQLTDYSLRLNETQDLTDSMDIAITGTSITMYKNAYYHEEISSYSVGDRLYAKMVIDNNRNPTLSRGYKLHPVTCFATSDRDGNDNKYLLLEDGCILDDTFRFENERSVTSQGREAFFSFESFSFKENPGKLYLHCTSLACINPTSRNTKTKLCDVTCKKNNEQTSAAPLEITVPPAALNETITRGPGSKVEIFTSLSTNSP